MRSWTRHSTATYGTSVSESMKPISSIAAPSTGWHATTESSRPSRPKGARRWRSATLAGKTLRARGSISLKASSGAAATPAAWAMKDRRCPSPISPSSSRAVSSAPPSCAWRATARSMSALETAPSSTSSAARSWDTPPFYHGGGGSRPLDHPRPREEVVERAARRGEERGEETEPQGHEREQRPGGALRAHRRSRRKTVRSDDSDAGEPLAERRATQRVRCGRVDEGHDTDEGFGERQRRAEAGPQRARVRPQSDGHSARREEDGGNRRGGHGEQRGVDGPGDGAARPRGGSKPRAIPGVGRGFRHHPELPVRVVGLEGGGHHPAAGPLGPGPQRPGLLAWSAIGAAAAPVEIEHHAERRRRGIVDEGERDPAAGAGGGGRRVLACAAGTGGHRASLR